MKGNNKNIYPVFNWILLRDNKEKLLKQKAKVLWMSGLSGAGKSTLAAGLEKILFDNGYLTQVIDGDNIRTGLNFNLGFSEADRLENLRRIAEVSKLFLNCGIIVINSFISPTSAIRERVKRIVGEEDFIEVYVNAPIEVCEARDVKGLYRKARQGIIKDFTGIDSPFEPPEHPDIELNTDQYGIDECVEQLFKFVLPRIEYKQ
ncbi:MAG: adenylyl-sulfate kinase [Bacteroidales bacterium]|nr:adenylyl-sulfate kinase [Bacteroidales bacterium]